MSKNKQVFYSFPQPLPGIRGNALREETACWVRYQYDRRTGQWCCRHIMKGRVMTEYEPCDPPDRVCRQWVFRRFAKGEYVWLDELAEATKEIELLEKKVTT